jgi:hypothetical protein
MNAETRKALGKSLKEFGNISGITLNETTGNVLSGNHRYEELMKQYGKDKISYKKVIGEYHAMMLGEKFTGWLIRVVKWTDKKEKMANVAANSPLMVGEFTEDLQSVLEDIDDKDTALLMEELRLDEMKLDFDGEDDDIDFDEEQTQLKTKEDNKRKKTIKDLEDDEDDSKTPSAAKQIISTIKITGPAEHKEEIMEIILKALSKKKYYDDLTIN